MPDVHRVYRQIPRITRVMAGEGLTVPNMYEAGVITGIMVVDNGATFPPMADLALVTGTGSVMYQANLDSLADRWDRLHHTDKFGVVSKINDVLSWMAHKCDATETDMEGLANAIEMATNNLAMYRNSLAYSHTNPIKILGGHSVWVDIVDYESRPVDGGALVEVEISWSATELIEDSEATLQ